MRSLKSHACLFKKKKEKKIMLQNVNEVRAN